MRQATPMKPIHFLLVEDDDDHAQLVLRAMERTRIETSIDHVNDGTHAMHYLRREPPYESAARPDVVLLDLKMPEMGGHDVLKNIKADPVLQSIPVVILTTSAAESDRASAYSHHANSYLVKPLDFDCFQDMIEDLSLYWAIWNQRPPATTRIDAA
ncbi:MAG: response regulator [Planctomycetota bacterium]